MNCERLLRLSDNQFRRSTGVKRTTFDKMKAILSQAQKIKKAKGGRPNKLSIEQQLIMGLMYWREYRTYMHCSLSFGISESSAYKTIKWVEDTLIKEGSFSLPGKKALYSSEEPIEVILVDATETPIERPKKSRKNTIRERKKGIP